MMQGDRSNGVFQGIYRSFRDLPIWVQVWMSAILIPINMASFAFLDQPLGLWVCFLAVGGMIPNLPLIFFTRSFSKMLALPHLPFWTVLVCFLLFARPNGSNSYDTYLQVLLATNFVSLIFDYVDAFKWWKVRS